ncbi:RraA family protein [Bauldia litoralis]|uniref:Putative 4-hydroxy-4-methyl-2-oxoglutarate aldolase n=1 Tax=Bauldia litoralis TaxID=665467 RepID=A0A1G6EAZ5_9HYPH|nr:RraA family protein [Bauldia litoralis]SDB54568.1 Regulator of RNase E activity RraA [Bauldia litoralis]
MVIFSAETKQKLYTAVLSDVLDGLGYPDQALRPFVRPLDESLVLLGKARTGGYTNTYSVEDGENPYELEIKLLDDLKPGEVPVLGCDGPTERLAPWGELLTTAALQRGGVGCVTDGLVRDVRKIRELKFPVFHGGIGPLDSRGRGRMIEMDRPVACGGVTVHSGDIIFGDVDGVVVVPQAIAEEAFKLALAKVTDENHTRDELLKGNLLADVYAKYGVL